MPTPATLTAVCSGRFTAWRWGWVRTTRASTSLRALADRQGLQPATAIQTLVHKLTAVSKGSLVTVSGRLTYEVYNDKDGVERVSTGLVASKISNLEGGSSEAEAKKSRRVRRTELQLKRRCLRSKHLDNVITLTAKKERAQPGLPPKNF